MIIRANLTEKKFKALLTKGKFLPILVIVAKTADGESSLFPRGAAAKGSRLLDRKLELGTGDEHDLLVAFIDFSFI